ncbi:transposase IS204/IS1001/IS1096/IS1165 family protein [Caldithrix abyssi DSM 13497]|uniref:Transposase n=1 Tax=Caldithrix abyssi DSM 13497 TaxID=880073 RepID=H1XUY7_CALAY|nr:ISL3 family transposase [Caldithrix abyssi]APF16796.1 Transposase [Caldithrix abyssi DSM 13497]APF18262.1 Transposase [Caldithrix abyssi DSM 13497]APF18847.1 Transposase [Caldithrix abyssi DSM 13497]APF18968.1 Transposase [Caldithrix abyssi DSM 13497]APF19824.1 Transposase [Caldithrix abyssi DSM 13497]
MKDKELFKQILGLSHPWEVSKVDLDIANEEVEIEIIYKSKKGFCPECEVEYDIYDHREKRRWRHLDTCQMKTYIVCKVPRIKCKEHGVKTIKVPWAEKSSRTTLLFERFAIELLLASKNQSKTAQFLRISFDMLHHIMSKAVERGLSRRTEEDIKYIGIDEKSMKRGHTYVSVLSDSERRRVIDVSEGRTTSSASSLINKGLTEKQKEGLKAVSMDMWKAFIKAVQKELPNASIVHDKFHIMKYLNDGVDKTRREEARKLQKSNDKTLVKSKYLFLKNLENMTDKQLSRFRKIQELNLITSQAWAAKENFKEFFRSETINDAKFFFAEWYQDIKERSLNKMIKVAKMLIAHSDGLLNYIRYQIDNSVAEWLNGKIQEIKTVGRGFRKFENFRIAILFFLGKLDLFPQESQ